MSTADTMTDLARKTEELRQLFAKVENRPWTIEAYAIELLAEVGTLADSLMIQENYRSLRADQDPLDLEDDIVDVMFVLFMIANHYGIDVAAAYGKMVEETKQKIAGMS